MFLTLDKGLSGGSAQNPALGIGYIALAIAFILYLGSGLGGDGAEMAAIAYGFLPLIALLTLYGASQSRWENRPEAVAQRALAADIRCSVEKAGLAEGDRPYVRVRIGLIAEHGEVGEKGLQTEIEQRMRIRILPGCEFERTP
jgi:hypothetical protein